MKISNSGREMASFHNVIHGLHIFLYYQTLSYNCPLHGKFWHFVAVFQPKGSTRQRPWHRSISAGAVCWSSKKCPISPGCYWNSNTSWKRPTSTSACCCAWVSSRRRSACCSRFPRRGFPRYARRSSGRSLASQKVVRRSCRNGSVSTFRTGKHLSQATNLHFFNLLKRRCTKGKPPKHLIFA